MTQYARTLDPSFIETMSLIIKNALTADGTRTDILIESDKITALGCVDTSLHPDAEIIDASTMAVVPGFINCHTHAAMTLFRGYGDDRDLMDWLENMIWPVEEHITKEEIYWGSRLACLEMIKSGTTAFLDMYAMPEATAEAVIDSGIRAVLSYTMFDRWEDKRAKLDRERCKYYYDLFAKMPDRVQFAVGPHAIYTVSGPQLQYASKFAEEHDCIVNLHLSETYTEWQDCVRRFGKTPVRYLKELGILSPRLVLAHSLWMDSDELKILADYGCSTVHNPASNMKLASGYHFRYHEMKDLGIKVGLGTDGCSSSNNLDMIVAMKLASFMGKAWRHDPKAMPAHMIFDTATKDGAEILRIDAGRIEVGALAGLCLIDLTLPEMTPLHNLTSNIVYAAAGNCVDTVIIDGKVLMRHREIEGEAEIRREVIRATQDLFHRSGRSIINQ